MSCMICLVGLTVVSLVADSPTQTLDDFSDDNKMVATRLMISVHKSLTRQPRTHPDSVEAAACIHKLAVMRAKNAVPLLVEYISFQPQKTAAFVGPLPTLRTILPSVYALGEIGPPAFPAVLKLSESDDSGVTHMYCALVFRRSLGRDQAAGYLNLYAAGLTDVAAKARIRAVARLVLEKPLYPGSDPILSIP